jgi:hypothetical protein
MLSILLRVAYSGYVVWVPASAGMTCLLYQ